MPVAIGAALVAVGVGATTAAIVANVAIFVIGIGLSLIASTLFKPKQPKPSDGQTIIKQSTAPRFRSYGRVKVGGVLMFANTRIGFFDRVIAMGSGEIDAVEEHWVDDTEVTLGGVDGWDVQESKYQSDGSPRVLIQFGLGTDSPTVYGLTTVYPTLWTANHLGKGIPSGYIRLWQPPDEDFADMFPKGGDTTYRQVQRGAKVRGMAGGSFTAAGWSENAAAIIADYLTHADGLGLADSWITNAASTWEAAMTVCDEDVDLDEGGTEKRYRIWSTYYFDERPADVLARFLQACDGAIYPTPGQGLAIKVGQWETPTFTIDDDAVIGFSEFGRGRDILTTANTVRARYTDPEQDYLETDADQWVDAADVAIRGEYATDLELFPVPSHTQARRLMKIAAHRANPEWVGTLTCNLRALPVMGERFVNVELAELGIIGTFEVLNVEMLIDEGTILNGVRIQIASLTSAAYGWDETSEQGTPAAVSPPIVSDLVIPAPTGLSVTTIANASAALTWDAPPSDFLSFDAQFKKLSDTNWLPIPVSPGVNATVVGPLESGVDYEFQIRHVSRITRRVSDWTASAFLTGAIIDFDFVADSYYHFGVNNVLSSRVSVDRPSDGYAENVNGSWTAYGSNVARRSDMGLLVEEARTNEISNNSMQGAVAGSPGTIPTNWVEGAPAGLTRTISLGTENGIDYIEFNYQGTTSSSAPIVVRQNNIPSASIGETWTGSVFSGVSSAVGISTFIMYLQEFFGAAFVVQSATPSFSGDSEFARRVLTRTLTGALTDGVRTITLTDIILSAVVVDFTVRFGWPQLELGSWATSPIRTTGTAATREADVVSVISPPAFSNVHTLFAGGAPDSPAGNATIQAALCASDGTPDNMALLNRESGTIRPTGSTGGVAYWTGESITASVAAGSSFKAAAAFAPSDQAGIGTGGTLQTNATGTPAALPSAAIHIGCLPDGSLQFNGYVERVIVWPYTRLPNSSLVNLTA